MFDHGILWYLVVGKWLAELVDFLQQILSYLADSLDCQFIYYVLHILA